MDRRNGLLTGHTATGKAETHNADYSQGRCREVSVRDYGCRNPRSLPSHLAMSPPFRFSAPHKLLVEEQNFCRATTSSPSVTPGRCAKCNTIYATFTIGYYGVFPVSR